MIHNIVTGTVTNRRDHVPFIAVARKIVRRTLIVAGVILAAMLALGFALQATGHAEGATERVELPVCAPDDPDGTQVPVCFTHGVHDVINYDHGGGYIVIR